MAPLEKTLLVLGPAGAGKATAIGYLLFKFDSIDMFTVERFQREEIQSHDQVAKDLKSRGVQASFNTPSFRVTVSDGPSKADCVLLVIPADSTHVDLEKELDGAADQAKQIIVLINKMDTVGWSEETFQQIVKSLGPAAESVPIIPFCASKGDNVMEVSSKNVWYKGTTLLEALEASFRA